MHVHIKVSPRGKRSEFLGKMSDGTWKIRVRALPEKGAANEELIDFLSEWCKINRDEIILITGKSSPHKIFQLPDSCSIL